MVASAEVKHDPDIFTLDKGWLRPLGLLRGGSLRGLTADERLEALDVSLARQPFVLTGAGYDPASHQLISLTSLTTYDQKSGILDHKIVYWRYLPEANDDQRASSDQHVISIRGIRSPEHVAGEVPEIIPDQIWFNGSNLFNGPTNGGADDPHRPENRRLLTRVMELSKRVHEHLGNLEPVHELGKWLAGGALDENFSAKALGGAPVLRGLSDKGDWDPYERVLSAYFTDLAHRPDEKVIFSFPPLGPLTPLDRLKSMLGGYRNTIEPIRSLGDSSDEHAGDLETGISYLSNSTSGRDKKTGNHVFRNRIEPLYVPDDQTACDPFDVMRLEFSQPKPTSFQLENASFMGNGPDKCRNFATALNHVGFAQDVNRAFAKHMFPPFHDIAARNNLLSLINELHVPPYFAEKGGEMMWAPLFGTSMEKKIDIFGAGIGGGQLFLQRGRKADGSIDEIAVLHDLPFEPGNSESDYDGAQPDITRFRDSIKRGILVISHCHFDHSTIEYYAKQIDENGNGWFKGQKVLCTEIDAYVMKDRFKTLGVDPRQWPEFITFNSADALEKHPDLYKIDDDQFAYRVRDEEGNTRFWVQVCEDGTRHSALTLSTLITGCYNDDHYQDTYYIDSDAVGLTPHGWKFAEQGQLALAKLPDVSLEKLKKVIRSENELYISLEETTGVDKDGHAPTFDQSKADLRTLMKAMPADHTLVVVPFSTNTLDYQAVMEVCNETDTLRNITAVGKNAETRLTAMNKHGLYPRLDLKATEIPAEKLPQQAYDAALAGVTAFINRRNTSAQRSAARRDDGADPESLLVNDQPYQIMRAIADEARRDKEAGQTKPRVLFDVFLSGKTDAFDAIAARIGLPATATPRVPPSITQQLRDALTEQNFEAVRKGGDPRTDTAAFMLRSLVKNGRVTFATTCSINDAFMYRAIMDEQETASSRAVRTSKRAKEFRNDTGRLAVFSTGPLGTAEEFMAAMSRFRRGDSLFDYDEVTRNSGYKLDPNKMTILVMQTPSMGREAGMAQDSLVRAAAYERGVTVHVCSHGGLRTINPGAYRTQYQNAFHEDGWQVTNIGTDQDMYSHGRMIHIRGHRFQADMEDKLRDPRLKSKLTEVIHNPSQQSYVRMREICARAGRIISIQKPDDNIARQYREDEKGRPYMKDMDYMSEVYWLIKRHAKFGKQYNWVVDMVKAVVMSRRGPGRMDPLQIRSDKQGDFAVDTASMLHNLWNKPQGRPSSKQAQRGPSIADIRPANTRPLGPSAGSMLRRGQQKVMDYV